MGERTACPEASNAVKTATGGGQIINGHKLKGGGGGWQASSVLVVVVVCACIYVVCCMHVYIAR